MAFTRTRFATPVSPNDVNPGDILTIDAGFAWWLAVGMARDELGRPMAMLLAGPDLRGERAPLPVDLLGLDEGLGRIAAARISIEPWPGESLGLPGVSQNGSLIIDGQGVAWLAYRSRTRLGSRYLSLVTFDMGAPARPVLAYPTWRIVLRDGPNEHELVAFAPGRTFGPDMAKTPSPPGEGSAKDDQSAPRD